MMITGFVDINGKAKNFFFDGKQVILAPETTISWKFPAEESHFDLLSGVTSTNREIFFIDCDYYEGQKILAKGWIIGTNSTGTEHVTGFDSLRFSGTVLDCFFSPGRAFKIEKEFEEKVQGDNYSRVPSLVTVPFEEYCVTHNMVIAEENIEVNISVYVSYSLEQSERKFGERYTTFTLRFKERKKLIEIPKYYLYMYDLCQFISFRRNVGFDKIEIWDRQEGHTDKYAQKAICQFFVPDYKIPFSKNQKSVITYEDVQPHFDKFLETIFIRRSRKFEDSLFIPLDDKDAKRVTHSRFLDTALSFEGQYTKMFPDIKSNSNLMFAEIKQLILENIKKSSQEYGVKENLSKTKSKKAEEYFDKFVDAVDKVDSSLEEKFNDALKKFPSINEELASRIVKEEMCLPIQNYGEVFSKMRNYIGHGFPPQIENKHVAVFRIARILIYALILSECEFEDRDIKKMLIKLRM